MVSFPFRLILAAYGMAAVLGWASWATGGTGLGALLVFWLGGTLGLFVLPALLPAFRIAEEPADLSGGLAPGLALPGGEIARWEADLAEERGAPPQAGFRRAG